MATKGVDYTRRYYIRQRDPAYAFMPWGCLPLLGLLGTFALALGPFAWSVIPENVHDTARTALDAAGMSWVKIDSVDGQNVHLSGTEPIKGAGDRAKALVRGESRYTWLLPAVPAVSVTGDFASPAPKAPAKPAAKPGNWTWTRDAKSLLLKGLVPTAGVKTATVAAAKKAVGPDVKVIDQLKVQGIALPDGYQAMALRGIDVVTPCTRGTSSWIDGKFSLHCLIPADKSAATEAAARVAPTFGGLGVIEMLSPEAVAKCEEALTTLLAKSKIQFDSGKANIKAASNPLLDKIANEAKNCPGTLLIEGHTDSQGADDFNQKLSQSRAEATRAALVKREVVAGHLRARGFGESRPIATNDTPEGMAQNRRIEIHVSLED